jgi:hypothetical protein
MSKSTEDRYLILFRNTVIIPVIVSSLILFLLSQKLGDFYLKSSQKSPLEEYFQDDYKDLKDWNEYSSYLKAASEARAAGSDKSEMSESKAFIPDSTYFPKGDGHRGETFLPRRATFKKIEKLQVDSGFVTGNFYGPVGALKIQKIYTNTNSWPRNGALVEETIITPPGAGIHSFWITERGVKIPAVVRAATKASEDFRRTVRKGMDPGLIQCVKPDEYKFSLYPVLKDGTPKTAEYQIAAVYEVDAEGWVEIQIPAGKLPVNKLEVDITIETPFPISRFRLPSELKFDDNHNNSYRISGVFHKLSANQEDIKIAWRYPSNEVYIPYMNQPSSLPYRKSIEVEKNLVQYGDSLTLVSLSGLPSKRGNHSLSLLFQGTGLSGSLGTLEIYDESKTKSLSIEVFGKGVHQLPSLPEDLERRIVSAMEIGQLTSELYLSSLSVADNVLFKLPQGSNDERAEEIAKLSIDNNMASPLAALYAKPQLSSSDTIDNISNDSIRTEVTGKGPSTGYKSQIGESTPMQLSAPETSSSGESWIGFSLVPNFQSARRRSYERACFANQKTLAGALEMLCLDYNTDMSKIFEKVDSRVLSSGTLNQPAVSESNIAFNPGPQLAFIPADSVGSIKCLHKIPVEKSSDVSFSHNYSREEVNPDDLDIMPVNCEGKVVYSLKISKGDPLLSGGYLQSEPRCPRTNESRYLLAGDRIFCPVHGSVHRSNDWYKLRKMKETCNEIAIVALFLLAVPFFFFAIPQFLRNFLSIVILAGLLFLFFFLPVPVIAVMSIAGIYRAISENCFRVQALGLSLVFFIVALINGELVMRVIPEIAIAVAVVLAVIFFYTSWIVGKKDVNEDIFSSLS